MGQLGRNMAGRSRAVSGRSAIPGFFSPMTRMRLRLFGRSFAESTRKIFNSTLPGRVYGPLSTVDGICSLGVARGYTFVAACAIGTRPTKQIFLTLWSPYKPWSSGLLPRWKGSLLPVDFILSPAFAVSRRISPLTYHLVGF